MCVRVCNVMCFSPCPPPLPLSPSLSLCTVASKSREGDTTDYGTDQMGEWSSQSSEEEEDTEQQEEEEEEEEEEVEEPPPMRLRSQTTTKVWSDMPLWPLPGPRVTVQSTHQQPHCTVYRPCAGV